MVSKLDLLISHSTASHFDFGSNWIVVLSSFAVNGTTGFCVNGET